MFWGLVASMYIGNVLLLVINLPFVGVLASLLKTPREYLVPLIIAITFVGALATNNTIFDVGVLILFGFIGFVMKEADYPPAPLAIGIILGPTIEQGLIQGLIMGDGNPAYFFIRPISGIILTAAIILLVITIWKRFVATKNKREAA